MESESPKWVVMVYISADGVLANFAVESLKQLKRGAGDGVVVVAQVDANGPIPAKRYVFDRKNSNSSINVPKPTPVKIRRGGTPDPGNLTEFVNDVTKQYPDGRYCLFLWGHGTELLLDDDAEAAAAARSKNSKRPVVRYLTPLNLKKALAETKVARAGKKISILGLDACSMNMIEIASELGNSVEIMVASQEDVPDLSFPYYEILAGLKETTSAEHASKTILAAYKDAYSDYIADPGTGISGLSLASLRLEKVRDITRPLTVLAKGLLDLSFDEILRKKIFTAREKSHAFDFGLFVDLADFCNNLTEELEPVPASNAVASVRAASEQISKAIALRSDGCVVETQNVVERRSSGLSIYFPFATNEKTAEFNQLPVKNGRTFPEKQRSATIAELERDFAALEEFRETGWNRFIKQGWSVILATEHAEKLDEHYSAQQCAQNLALYGQVAMASAA